MNALRLYAGSRRILAETSRAATNASAASQRRNLHADAPFLFSLPSDPEASMARTATNKTQHTPTSASNLKSQRLQTTAASPSQTPRSGTHSDAPYILSVPPEFDSPAVTAGTTGTSAGQLRA